MSDVVIARKSFAVGNRIVHQGETFRADHEIVAGREVYFDPFDLGDLDREVETATAGPGERRRRVRRDAAKDETAEETPADETPEEPADEPETPEDPETPEADAPADPDASDEE